MDTYYASEIDTYAIKVTQKNYPDTIQLGDVRKINFTQFKNIDLVMGGSPCTDLSVGKRDRKGLKGEESSLFWEFVRALREVKPEYFLFENVASMKEKDKQIITKELGVEPILIDSSLFSAQTRKRLYWTNISNITQPTDRGIQLKDILLPREQVEHLKLSEKEIAYMDRQVRDGRTHWDFGLHSDVNKGKSQCLVANLHKGVPYNVLIDQNGLKRKFHPIECEKLQGLPDNYTEGVSNTQRYRLLGNAWNVDTVTHILSFIKNKKQ